MRYLYSLVFLALTSVVASASPVTGTLTAHQASAFVDYTFSLTDGTHTFQLSYQHLLYSGIGVIGPVNFSSQVPSSYHFDTQQLSYSGIKLVSLDGGAALNPAAPALRYTVDFVFSPYSGGVLIDNSHPLIGPPGTQFDQTLTGANSTFTGSIQVTNSATGVCVFCWSGSGTSITDGRNLRNTYSGDGTVTVTQTFTGSEVPEPAGMGVAGLLLLAAGVAFRSRR